MIVQVIVKRKFPLYPVGGIIMNQLEVNHIRCFSVERDIIDTESTTTTDIFK